MDYWGRTGGLSIVPPTLLRTRVPARCGPVTNGVSDVGFLWQMNIFGGPALTREQFRTFVPQEFASFHHVRLELQSAPTMLTSPINRVSANRWTVSPLINCSDATRDCGWRWRFKNNDVTASFSRTTTFLRKRGTNALAKSHLPRETYKPEHMTDRFWLSGRCLLQRRG